MGELILVRYSEWPKPERGEGAVKSVIETALSEGRLGLDLEYNDVGPTIIGVASKGRAAAWNWSKDLGTFAISHHVPIAAHAGIGADKAVIEKALGITTPLAQWNDTMVKHWIVNPDLSSVSKAMFGDDQDDPGIVFAMMNLWAATSLLHDIPNWKECVGLVECQRTGRPCPEHNPLDYCAIDSWAGLVNDYALDEQMADLKIPATYYDFRARLTEYCVRMTAKGIRVDREVINQIEKTIQDRKHSLFPSRLSYEGKPYKNGKPRTLKKPRVVWEGPFNPNSPEAALAWFADHGIQLSDRSGKPSMGKQIVLSSLEKQLRPYGLGFNVQTGEPEPLDPDVDIEADLSEPVDMLLRLAQKTVAGKGLKSWFSADHIQNDEAHPRFITTGTSTGRLSSAKPNFQNIPRVGFGAEVRRALVARPGYKLVKADFSQLEFRVCLWAAGVDPNIADGAFELLVARSEGQFERAAERLSWKPRDVAKSAVHGGDYLEGVQIKSARELSDDRAVKDRKAGALLVYDGHELPEWQFRGGYVCFTGANLAERLFGDRTRENRAKALKIQQVYMDAFPQIREFQMQVSRDVETSYEVRLPSGHRVPLYGRKPEDDLKFAAALIGQGGGAIYAQEGMLRFAERGELMNLQVHDEYVFEVPETLSDEECLAYMSPMVKVSTLMPGFSCPAKVSVSRIGTWQAGGKEIVATTHNWKQTVELGTIRA